MLATMSKTFALLSILGFQLPGGGSNCVSPVAPSFLCRTCAICCPADPLATNRALRVDSWSLVVVPVVASGYAQRRRVPDCRKRTVRCPPSLCLFVAGTLVQEHIAEGTRLLQIIVIVIWGSRETVSRHGLHVDCATDESPARSSNNNRRFMKGLSHDVDAARRPALFVMENDACFTGLSLVGGGDVKGDMKDEEATRKLYAHSKQTTTIATAILGPKQQKQNNNKSMSPFVRAVEIRGQRRRREEQ
jgi:hypothetical protein